MVWVPPEPSAVPGPLSRTTVSVFVAVWPWAHFASTDRIWLVPEV